MNCADCPYNRYTRIREGAILAPSSSKEIVVIGDIPSVIEARTGKVLQSRGGDVLRATLKTVGLPYTEDKVHFTTALKCAVPKKSGAKPSKVAIRNCREQLIEEIAQTEAKLVIVLGATALQSLFINNAVKLQEVQGLVQTVEELPGVEIVPVVHPALLLSSPGQYKVFLRHFEFIASLYKKQVQYDPGTTVWSICRTKEDVLRARDFLATKGRLGCDIETTQLSAFYSKQQGVAGRSLVIGIAFDKNKVIGFAKSAIPYMQCIFDLDNEFVWHGGKFDVLFERVADELNLRLDHDLMLAHYCLNETSNTHKLEQIAMQVLNAPAYKSEANAWIKSKEGFEAAPEEVQIARVCTDADYTLQAFEILYPQVCQDENLKRLYHERLLPGAAAYTVIEQNGMKLDAAYLESRKVIYEQQISTLIAQIQESVASIWNVNEYKCDTKAKSAPDLFSPTSPKQLAWVIYDKLGLKPKKRKKRSTDKEVLESIPNPPEVIVLLLQLRTVKKEYDTYVKGLLKRKDETDRVHSTFSLHITATGRRSSTDPNVQNIPSRRPDIRKAFIPEKGKVLAEIDYSAAESRVLAILANDENYLKVFLEGRDPHGEVAEQLYGPNYTKAQRGRAKAVNFGVPYGRQAFSLAQEHEMPVEEAQGLIDAWAKKYPKAWKYLQDVSSLVLEGKALQSPMGRYKRPGLITPELLDGIQNEYKNFNIQSTVAEFTLLSVIKLQKLLDPNECKIINEVHDSLLFELVDDDEVIRRNCTLIADVMSSIPREYLGWTLPFHCDIEVGYNWAEILDMEDFIKMRSFIQNEGFKAAKQQLK